MCQRKRLARNKAHDQTSDLYRAVETLKTTEASSFFHFFLLFSLHRQEGRWLFDAD